MTDTAGVENDAQKLPIRIAALLDRSGSMKIRLKETLSALNEWRQGLIDDNDKYGEALVTVFQFDTEGIETMFEDQKPQDTPAWDETNFQPRGGTNLYDALGDTIGRINGRCLYVIMTDGEENSSRKLNSAAVKTLIEKKTAEGWTFLYLGANQDAFTAGETIGVAATNTMNFSAAKFAATGQAIKSASTSYRSSYGAKSENLVADIAKEQNKTEDEVRKDLTE